MLSVWLTRQWFQRRLTPALCLLLPLFWPLSWLYGRLAARAASRTRPECLPVPVVVVGNLIVGGAGKTPLTLALARALTARGWTPGIVSRGYASTVDLPKQVKITDDPAEVGDEPLLLARKSGVPVCVARRRAEAGRALLAAHPEVDLLLCDDGLQHHALARDVELAVFDRRGVGNGHLLPLGPLREPLARLAKVDAVIGNGLSAGELDTATPFFPMRLRPGRFQCLDDPAQTCDAAALRAAGRPLYALAGIGHPERFFTTLRELGLDCRTRAFPDHHAYTAADLAFADDGILLLTEKDAVKCAAIARAGGTRAETWVLPVEAELPNALIELIVEKLRGRPPA